MTPGATGVGPRSTRARVVDGLRIGLLLLVLGGVGYALWSNWAEVQGDLRRLDATTVAVATFFALASPACAVLGWRVLLADLGSPLHIAPASGVFFVGQLGKYLPGSVWSVVVQTEMAARLGVPRRRTAVVGLLAIGLAAVTALVVGLPALPVLLTRGEADVPPWAVLLGVVPLLLLLWPPLLNLGIRIGLRLLRQPPLEQPLGPRAVARSCLWWAVSWGMGGVSVWVLTRALAPEEVSASRLALIAICGYLLAAGVSMLSIVVPAGVGVREGVLGLLLTTEVSLPAATAVVVVARFLTVVVDIVVAAAGWGWARAHDLLPERDRVTS